MSNELSEVSFWFDSLGALEAACVSTLPQQVDVAIVGAGFTGLWTAYYLKQRDPSLRIAVLEAERVGFGASGRNGGWCMGSANGLEQLLANPHTRSRGLALARALFDTVDEVGRVCRAEHIDAHFAKGGQLSFATVPFHADAYMRQLAHLHALGFGDADYRWLTAAQAGERLRMTPNHGALFAQHCAVVQPARLVRGLAEAVRRQGTLIAEQTPVHALAQACVHSARGTVRAGAVIRATEGYTDSIAGQRRRIMPLYSMLTATEPLPAEIWQQLGLQQRECFGDARRVVMYGQRTFDDRLVLGGRAGYYFGSRRRAVVPADDPKVVRVRKLLRTLFPQLADFRITHGWGGLMGVPRHWRPCVRWDPATRSGWAGGYVGEGVAASNLAGRTLADLVLGQTTALTELPWVNDEARRWEPEPLRWLGAQAIEAFGDRADRAESHTGRPSKLWGALFDLFVH